MLESPNQELERLRNPPLPSIPQLDVDGFYHEGKLAASDNDLFVGPLETETFMSENLAVSSPFRSKLISALKRKEDFPLPLIDCDEDDEVGIDIEEIERAEQKLLKNNETLFLYEDHGSVFTPVHSSLTRLMQHKGLKLTHIFPGEITTEYYEPTEKYVPFEDDHNGLAKIKHGALLSYEIRQVRVKLGLVDSNAYFAKAKTYIFRLNPIVEFLPHEESYRSLPSERRNVRDLVAKYPNNSQGRALEIMTGMALAGITPMGYIA